MNKKLIFFNSFKSIVILIVIVILTNLLTLALQPLGEMIFTQSYIKNSEQDKQVISFHGLILIQKAFIWLMVSALIYLLPKLGKYSINKETIERAETQNEQMNIATQQNQLVYIPLKYELPTGIAIGIFSTASLLLFAQAQQKLYIESLSQVRHAGCFVAFIIIHFWFLTQNKLMKINLNNFFTQFLYLAFKCCQFYYLIKSAHFIVSRSVPYDHYFGLWYEQFNTGTFNDISFSSKPDLWAASFFQGAMYFSIFLFKSYHTNTISTLRMLLIMVKYSTIALVVYSIYYGDLLQTIHFVLAFPVGYFTILQYCMVNFAIYLIYAYSIASYPPTVFMVVLITRRLFERYPQYVKNDEFLPHYNAIFVILSVLALEMIKYAWFDQKNKMNLYDKLNRKPNQEMTQINIAVDNVQLPMQTIDDSSNSERRQ